MYQRIRNLLFHTLVPAVLAAFLFSFPAFAEVVSCTVNIPVEVTVSGTGIPAGMEYEVLLEKVTENASMPEDSSLIIKDGGKASFGPIVYTVPGDYQYRIRQKIRQKDNFTFDESTYLVTVRVLNTEDGGLTAVITAVKNSESDKPDRVVFENKYTRPSSSDDDDDDDDDDGPSRVITGDNKPGPGNDPFSSFTEPENHDVITIDEPEEPFLMVLPKLGDMGAGGYLGGMVGALALLVLAAVWYRKLGRGEER